MSVDVALGRWLAFVIHPQAAWRRFGRRNRALLVGTYTGVSYLGTLIALLVLS